MSIIDFPDEIINNILKYLDWKSILIFLSTNRNLRSLIYSNIICSTFTKSYFKKIDITKVPKYNDKYILQDPNNIDCYFSIILRKIRSCEINKIYINRTCDTLDFIIETLLLMDNHATNHDIDVTNLLFMNLDFFNNFLVENINNYTRYLKDYSLIYNIVNNLVYFENKMLNSILYTSLYSDILLKNIPNFILTLLENKFLNENEIIKLMYKLKNYYIGEINSENDFIPESSYDCIYCYLHVLKMCIVHDNNIRINIIIYCSEIDHILHISKGSYYNIQLIKHCLNLYRFIVYYFRNSIRDGHMINIINTILGNNNCQDVNNLIVHKINTLCDIANYVDVPFIYYECLYKSIIKLDKNNICVNNLIINITKKCRKRKTFIEGYLLEFLKLLEGKINHHTDDKKLLDLTYSIYFNLDCIGYKCKHNLIKFVNKIMSLNTEDKEELLDLLYDHNDGVQINNPENITYEGDIFKFKNIKYIVNKIYLNNEITPPTGFEKDEYYLEE